MLIGSRVLTAVALALPVAFAATAAEAQANPHLGHVTTGFPGAPDGRGLAVTLAEEISLAMMHANFAAGNPADLAAMKTHAGHVLHLLDPQEGAQGPGLGFGVKPAAEAVANHMRMAGEAAGASESLRTHAGHVATAATSLVGRADQLAALANQILAAETAEAAAPVAEQMREAALQLDTGGDTNGNERVDLEGEAGMNQVENHIYLALEGERLPRILQ